MANKSTISKKESLTFSQRMGIKPINKSKDVPMDDGLRNQLWNTLVTFYWNYDPYQSQRFGNYWSGNEVVREFVIEVWTNYLKNRLDKLGEYWNDVFTELEEDYFNCEWNEVFEFIEFTLNNFKLNKSLKNKFIRECNHTLEKEFSAYRIVGGKFIMITSKQEIEEVEKAIDDTRGPVQKHLERALELLSDKKNPDPRNCIKESISAVEAICQKITGKKNATLGDALNIIRDKQQIELPTPLRDAFNKLYGYTSSKEGIRHALSDKSTLTSDDARFMFVSCSSFVNYLTAKSLKTDIR